MDLIQSIIASLSAVGLIAVVRVIIIYFQKHLKFSPFKKIWDCFVDGDTVIFLTGRDQGDTIKVSYNETIAAARIKDLLKIPLLKKKQRIIIETDYSIKIDDKNIITLGSEKTNRITKSILNIISGYIDYDYTLSNDLVINNEIFKSSFKDGYLQKDYGLIVKTNNPFNSLKKVLVIAGNHGLGTQASVLSLINKTEISKVISRVGDSNFYAVIESEFNKRFANNPIKYSIIRQGLLPDINEITKTVHLTMHEEIEGLMREKNANEDLLNHSNQIKEVSLEIGYELIKRGYEVDLDAIHIGAMLHDIGRLRSNQINHGIEGVNIIVENKDELLRRLNISLDTLNKVIEIVECHILGGIELKWIKEDNLNIIPKNYIPACIEAKIVSLVDQITHNRREQSVIMKESPKRDLEVKSNLYGLSEEIFNMLYLKKN
jgi:uncharacterized protein